MKKNNLLAFGAVVLSCLLSQEAFATPHCQPCPYSCSDLGLGHKDCSQASNAGGVCCVDLTQKGLELAQAREGIAGNTNASAAPCPPGFHPRSSKCSPQDRQHGCKDLRGPTGQTCVSM
jgi:hypothetical protein